MIDEGESTGLRWVRFASGGSSPRLGVLTAEGVHDLSAVAAGLPDECRAAVAKGDMVAWIGLADRWREALAEVFTRAPVRPAPQVRLLAPIPRPPKNIFCVGRNYRAHVAESAAPRRYGTHCASLRPPTPASTCPATACAYTPR